MQTREHLQKFPKWSSMNEGVGYKGVPTTSYNFASAKPDNNHALQTILGNGLFELLIASFAKKLYRSDNNGTLNRKRPFDLHLLYNLFFCKT